MFDIIDIGREWVADEINGLTDTITHISPSVFNEQTRYLPESVTSIPGFIRYDVNPFMREIIDCADIESPVREVNLMKGVQITYSTALESIVLYCAAKVRTLPMMYMTADKDLAAARIENNFIPMFNQSDLGHIIRSSDEGNSRKTGKTANHLQFAGGAYLVPFGAINASKMRSFSIAVMLKDEIDAWPDAVGRGGRDGCPDKLSDGRLKGYWERRKIFRGSTPLEWNTSKIYKQYKRGDQRQYMVSCRACGFSQVLKWETLDKETGVVGGFTWEIDDGTLVHESVRYHCQKCGHAHEEHDKEILFSEEHGAHWKPTAKPVEPGIRSYHLPAMYSPIGMAPWYSIVADYIEAYDRDTRKVKDITKYRVFYNNVLAMPFKTTGSKIQFTQVSAHRRSSYMLGQIPNTYATEYAGSPILFLMCLIDVHKSNLAVSVFGWCQDSKPFLIDYDRYEAEDCTDIDSPVWGRVQELVEEKIYTADDGREYSILMTLIDAGYANDTVTSFCSGYASGVYPILGRDRAAKNQTIKEFAEFTTQAGTTGFRILVDHYKDRMSPVLRRLWTEDDGPQKAYHFNAPINVTDKQLKELTVESIKEKIDPNGNASYSWERPQGVPNELWDLLGYGYAAAEIYAWQVCIQHFKLETIDWERFWAWCLNNLVDPVKTS
jgi:phage terminase large subunit GpA-like protein